MLYRNNVEMDDLFELRQAGDPPLVIGNVGQSDVGVFRANTNIFNRYAPAEVGENDLTINTFWTVEEFFEPELNQTITSMLSLGQIFAAKGSRVRV